MNHLHLNHSVPASKKGLPIMIGENNGSVGDDGVSGADDSNRLMIIQ